MHYHCFKRFRRQNSTCPVCKQDWPQEADSKPLVPVGEDAVKDGQEDGGRRVRRKDTTPERSGEEDEIDQDEPSQPAQPTQKKEKIGRASAATMDIDDDEEDDYAPKRRNH